MGSPLDSLSKEILGNDATRSLAARAIKERVDWIYGYSKYPVKEISAQLPERLHSMEYLGIAVGAILESDGQMETTKTSVAASYLGLLPLYLERRLPKDVYGARDEAEPVCVVEAADFLQERGMFDWNDDKVLQCVLRFASGSSVRAKKDFLSPIIGRMNRDEDFRRRFPAYVLSPAEEAIRTMGSLMGKKHDPYGLDRVPETRRKLLLNLRPLLDADSSGSSFGPLADLAALTDQDLVEFFLGVGGLFFLSSSRMNRVALFRDMAEGMLTKRGIKPADLLLKLDQRTDRHKFFYDDEAKTKGLLQLIQTRGEATQEVAKIIEKFLNYKMETDTRFQFLRFVYANTNDRSVLDRALELKSKKIRDWASKQKDKLSVPSFTFRASSRKNASVDLMLRCLLGEPVLLLGIKDCHGAGLRE